MKYFPIMGSLAMVGFLSAHPGWALGSSVSLTVFAGPEFLLYSAQGYLGVDLKEIDPDRISALRLKDAHGAEVTMVDHDAPAGKSGLLKVHDVILQLDGQSFDNVEQLRRRLHEMPSGRTISLLISRDGNPINVTVQLCDGAALGAKAWSEHWTVPDPTPPPQSAPPKSSSPRSGMASAFVPTRPPVPGFLDLSSKNLYVGADVNPVQKQLADYFGVRSGTGLLVENVDFQSPAARAGLKAGDVVVKVESAQMATRNDWLKAIHSHRGQMVQVTVMRNKQELVLTMSAGKPKNK
jgi:serine protease Do